MNRNPYADIINLPRPELRNHPRMARKNRAVQFAPFAALTGYDAAIAETGRNTQTKAILDESEIDQINKQLLFLAERLEEKILVSVFYFIPDNLKPGGKYAHYIGIISKIDSQEQKLFTENNLEIPFSNLQKIVLHTNLGAEP